MLYIMKKNTLWIFIGTMLLCAPWQLMAQQPEWPAVKVEMKPGARWWWMGSAVDSASLAYNL